MRKPKPRARLALAQPRGGPPRTRQEELLSKIKIVSSEEAEEASVVVCNTSDIPSLFDNNVDTTCALCGTGIYHRPHVPKRPPKVCIQCALAMSNAKQD